ncbi:MAG: folylpolyglutamate synthase/dihydrofolate synthase family protein, partial [Pseudomonadota bacterium]
MRTVDDWVAYTQTIHAREIDLSLDRVAAVYHRLLANGLGATIISVAGTNGKGSVSELLSSCYQAAGYKVGKYTSPHIAKFNERVEIDGKPVADEILLDAFNRVEASRADVSLTYFEFATLVAIVCFADADIDIAVMEVGLGGRLDAVNILDSDVAVITSISKDHTAWLGDTIEEIAFEKSGIVRAGKPAVIASDVNTEKLSDICEERGAVVHKYGVAYQVRELEESWEWVDDSTILRNLPLPFGLKDVQLLNAAACIKVMFLLSQVRKVSTQQIREGLKKARLNARCEVVAKEPLTIIDVAHNQDSLSVLARFIESREFSGRLYAICGMLKDKDVEASLAEVSHLVDEWHLASIDSERGSTAGELKE